LNKAQIINNLACKLDSLLSSTPQPPDAQIQIRLLASILRDITRDDDYGYSSSLQNIPSSGSTLAYSSGLASMSNSLVGEVEVSDRPGRSGDSRR